MRKGTAKLTAFVLIAGLILSGGSKDAWAAKKVQLNQKKVQLEVGKSFTLKVKNKKKKAKVAWKSKNRKIATVSKKGKVTGRKKGTTKVIATVKQGTKKKKLTCKVTVKAVKKPVPATPAVPSIPVQTPSVNPGAVTPPVNVQTPAPQEPTYHPNWPSTYSDTYVPLKDLAKGFKIGAAIAGSEEKYAAIYDADMRGILQKHYNTTTLTNLMKPTYLLDEEGSKGSEDGMPVVKFDTCEKELQFCRDTGIQMRGHVLVWYNQTPDWFFYEDYDTSKNLVDKATMKQRLESYIKQVVTYVQTNYPGVIYCWDVVNEAVGDDGQIRKSGNKWMDVYAEGNENYSEYEYVKDAFVYARKYVEPGVSLVYNDYNTFVPSKRAEILNLIRYVNQDEKWIDAVGMQCPILPRWPEISGSDKINREEDACVEYAIDDFSKEGLEIMITEMCVRTDGGNSEDEIRTQAARYKEMYELFLKMDTDNGGKANITSVTMFGISDSYRLYEDNSWRPGDESRYAWLFDKNCKVKLGFKCVYNVLAQAAGKETVPEEYEEPDGGTDQKTTHVVSGTVQSKNGVPVPDDFLIFYTNGSEDVFFANTDQNGRYRVELPDGDYMIHSKYIDDKISVSSEDEAAIEKNIELPYNVYHIYGIVRAANGTVMPDKNFYFSIEGEEGQFSSSQSIYTGTNGVFDCYLPEGKVYVNVDGEEQHIFDVTQDVEKENPVEVTLPYSVFQISGTVDAELLEFLGEKSYKEIYFQSDEKTETLYVDDETGKFSGTAREGQYALFVDALDEDGDEVKKIHYMNVTVAEDMTLSLEKKTLHELTIECEPDVGLESVTGENQSYPVGQVIYVGNVSDTIRGRGKTYDDEWNLTGAYDYEASYSFTEQDETTQKIVLNLQKYEEPVLKLGELTATTVSDICFDTSYMCKFTPEVSGTYTFYSASGISQEEDAAYANSEISVWNENDLVGSASSQGKDINFTCDVELEAGKTYSVEVILWSAWNYKDQLFPFGVTKAD